MPSPPTIDTSKDYVPNPDTVTLHGTCRAGSKIDITVDGTTPPGSPVTCSDQNTWDLPVKLAPGDHTVTVSDSFGHAKETVHVKT